MRHVILTCKNHPTLRWQCKEIAVNSLGQYNGSRSIFFNGDIDGTTNMLECICSPKDLCFAPEELERQKTEPLGKE